MLSCFKEEIVRVSTSKEGLPLHTERRPRKPLAFMQGMNGHSVRHRPRGRELLSPLSSLPMASNVRSWVCSRKREYERTKDEQLARKRGCPPSQSALTRKSFRSRTRPLSEQVWRVRTTARTPSASARRGSVVAIAIDMMYDGTEAMANALHPTPPGLDVERAIGTDSNSSNVGSYLFA
jgi:hypothetical protein